MAKGKKQSFRQRSAILLIIIVVFGFGAAISRLAYLQTIKADELQQRAVNQQLTDTALSAKRGTIYDRNGLKLAYSASVWRVVLSPIYFENDEERRIVAEGLSEILDVDSEKIFEKSKNKTYYEEIKRQIESDKRAEVLSFIDKISEEYDINPNVIYLLDDYKRYYPQNSLASSVIGFTGSDDQGLSGVEYQYNEILSGTPGRLVTATNSVGAQMPFKYSQNIGAIDGCDLILTIDETVQTIAEKYMQEGIEDNEVACRGVCIIMNVNNGEIYAMASVGGFDLNEPYTLSEETLASIAELPEEERAQAESNALSAMWRNKAVSDTYTPGSVFKMFTAAMAVELGVVTEESPTFDCPGYKMVDGEQIHCHNHDGHGTQALRDAIKNSCNPALMDIGDLVGARNFYQYYQAFGFSEKTGVDLPGEANDIFFSEDGSMLHINLATASFGQNFQVTPIQMATAVASIANGGYLVQPHVVSQIIDAEGNVVKTASTEVKRQVISGETADLIADILEENAVSGSGKNGYVAGYRVAGKTGTSEKKRDDNGDGINDYISSFCGFAPADKAEVVCLVFFDTPTGAAYYGSQVAAPVFAKIMAEVLPYLGVATQYTDEEIASLDKTADSYVGLTVEEALNRIDSQGFTYTVRGSGDTVIAQVPQEKTAIPHGGNVVLYTDNECVKEQVEVPSFKGYSINDVYYLASIYDVNVSITGATNSALSFASSQNIEAGTLVSPGTVIKVNFTAGGVND